MSERRYYFRLSGEVVVGWRTSKGLPGPGETELDRADYLLAQRVKRRLLRYRGGLLVELQGAEREAAEQAHQDAQLGQAQRSRKRWRSQLLAERRRYAQAAIETGESYDDLIVEVDERIRLSSE